MALLQNGEFLECRFALCIPVALVLEHGNSPDAAMATDLGQLRDLPGLQQLAVADDLHFGDRGDLFSHELEDRAAKTTSDAQAGLGAPQPGAEKCMVKTLAAGGEALDVAHLSPDPFDFLGFFGPLMTPLVLPGGGLGSVPFGAFLARFSVVTMALLDGAFGALLARLATIA